MIHANGRAIGIWGTAAGSPAVRGYAGCEVLAVSNWLLGRDDQIGCAPFWPIDTLEARAAVCTARAGFWGEP